MNSKLPINLADLLRQRTVEGERIEYKAGWNPGAIARIPGMFIPKMGINMPKIGITAKPLKPRSADTRLGISLVT